MRMLLVWSLLVGCTHEPDLDSADVWERRRAIAEIPDKLATDTAVGELSRILATEPEEGGRVEAIRALGRFGALPAATRVLAVHARGRDVHSVRAAALITLIHTRDPTAIPYLIDMFRFDRDDDDHVFYLGASEALVAIGMLAVDPLLEVVFGNDRLEVRYQAESTLRAIREPWTRSRLEYWQADPDPTRSAIARRLLDNLPTD